MKGYIIFAILALLSGTLFANPLMPMLIQQFWFNEYGEMMIQFGVEAQYVGDIGGSLEFFDGTGTYYYPSGNLVDATFPFIINSAMEMPGFTPDPLDGMLRLTSQNELIHEEAHWGSDITDDFTPLSGDQSAVQIRYSVNDPEGGHDIETWAKCPDYNTVEDYDFPARGTINVQIRDSFQNPVSGIPVYLFNQYTIAGTSDASGQLSFQHIPIKLQLLVYQPGSNFTMVVMDSTFFIEPGETYDLTAVITHTAVDDPIAITPVDKLEVFPSVCVAGQPMRIKYEGSATGDLHLELFDLKGRYIDRFDLPQTQPWIPPKLPSGMYLLRLTQKGKSLATARFINLK